MENVKMVVNTELDIIQYVNCVKDIAERYFNENGEYEPEIGILHTMCLFYNLCIKDSEFKADLGDTVSDIWDIRNIANNSEFVKEFNNAISNQNEFKLNFNNAYMQAMDIVETKKNSASQIFDLIRILGTEFTESITSMFNGININEIQQQVIDTSKVAVTES